MSATKAISITFSVVFTMSASVASGGEFRAVAKYESAINLSADGRVIVGGGQSPAPGGKEAWRWSSTGGQQWLGFFDPPNDPNKQWSCAAAASNDGSIVAGYSYLGTHHVINWPIDDITGFRWQNGTMTELPRLHDEAYPLDMAPDGSVVVGWDYEQSPTWLNFYDRAVRWVNGSPQTLGALSGEDSRALAVSDDGRTIVGISGEGDWDRQYWRPVVWNDGSVSPLKGFPSNPNPSSYYRDVVYEISGNGSYAVGTLYDGTHTKAVRWTTATRDPTALTLYGGDVEGLAYCISREGKLVGGQSRDRAVVWDLSSSPSTAPQLVENILGNVGLAPSIKGWKFTAVLRMAADGKAIAGVGVHPNGEQWIWHADLRNAPSNDRCANATQLSPGHTVNRQYTTLFETDGTTVEASMDGSSSCQAAPGPDLNLLNVWYQYSAPVDGYLYLDLCGSTGLEDAYISIHSGCPGTTLNQVYCTNTCTAREGCSTPCVMLPSFLVTAGQTYYIQVGENNDVGHSFALRHQFLPINEECDDAVLIETVPSSIPGTILRGSPAEMAQSCEPVEVNGPGVWYRVVGTGHTMTAATCSAADFDTRLTVYCSGCTGQRCVATDDDGCQSQSMASWCSKRGTAYHILVHAPLGESGAFWLDLSDDGQECESTLNCTPVNDDCEEALPVTRGTFLADNTGATNSSVSASCADSSNDLWYSYTTRCEGRVGIETCDLTEGTLEDTVVSAYDACSGVELGCNDDYSDATLDCERRSFLTLPSVPNQELFIRVAGYGAHSGPENQGTFPLRIAEVGDPLTVSNVAMAPAWQNQYYADMLPIRGGCGGRYVTATNVPEGMQVEAWSGWLSGTPTQSGLYSMHVDVCTLVRVIAPNPPEWECAAGDVTLFILATNDACADAIEIRREGGYAFGTYGTTTDGPPEPERCDFFGMPQVENDIWFWYTPSCTGLATIDLCDSDYNTKLAVYDAERCPTESGAAIACDEDSCAMQSKLAFECQAGYPYLIRIGGFEGQQGNGYMLITCFDDCNENGVSDLIDIAMHVAPDCDQDGVPDDCPGADYSCNDENVCTVDECVGTECAHLLIDCADRDRCTLDLCDGLSGCFHPPGVCGDFDGDGHTGLPDFLVFHLCMNGPNVPPTPPAPFTALGCLEAFDLDMDDDIDLHDCKKFTNAFNP